MARAQGREGWLRDAKRQLEHYRWQDPDPVSRSRSERLVLAVLRLEAELDAERAGNAAYEEYRAPGTDEERAAVRRCAEAVSATGAPGRAGQRD